MKKCWFRQAKKLEVSAPAVQAPQQACTQMAFARRFRCQARQPEQSQGQVASADPAPGKKEKKEKKKEKKERKEEQMERTEKLKKKLGVDVPWLKRLAKTKLEAPRPLLESRLEGGAFVSGRE